MRALATGVAAVVLIVFAGGCRGDNTKADLAAQDKVVQLGNQLAAIHQRVVQARRLVARQRRITARRAPQPARATAASSGTRVVSVAGSAIGDLCAPVKVVGNSKAARQFRKQRERARRQALYNLNLSCPRTRASTS